MWLLLLGHFTTEDGRGWRGHMTNSRKAQRMQEHVGGDVKTNHKRKRSHTETRREFQ